jgi:uncharacterized protein YoxC
MGIFDDIAEVVGNVVGTTVAIAAAPIAIALGVSVKAVQHAIDSGCRTIEEMREFIDLD